MLDISEIRTIEHDVLIVGAGGAGLSAAIESSAQGMSTGIVMKSLLGKAHTVMAEGGMAAALGNVDERDHWKIHFRDTMRGGKFLNVWRMVEHHAKLAPERVRLLEEWGAVFDRTKKGLINQRNFGGHRYPRLAHVGDRTGLEMIRTLQDHGIHQGIETYMECTALDLLKNERGEVNGIVCMWRETGSFTIFKAKSIIFATGGGGKAWDVTSNSWEYTGDGYAMAYEAGAELGPRVQSISPYRDGLAPVGQGSSCNRKRKGRRGHPIEQCRKALYVRLYPRSFSLGNCGYPRRGGTLARWRSEGETPTRTANP